eukprot:jgi/Antlo1/1612/269
MLNLYLFSLTTFLFSSINLTAHRLFFIVCKCGESAVILPCVLSLHSCTHLRRLDDAPSSLSLFELRLTVRVDTRARM